MTVVASKHKASKHKSAIDKPLNSSKMLHRNVSPSNLFGSLEDLTCLKLQGVLSSREPKVNDSFM
jgi:hypothetical protein